MAAIFILSLLNVRNSWTASEHGVPGEKVAVSGPPEVEPGQGAPECQGQIQRTGALSWWMTSRGTRLGGGDVRADEGARSDLKDPDCGLWWTRAASVKDTPHERRGAQGSRGPGRSPREQPSHFVRRIGGTPRSGFQCL